MTTGLYISGQITPTYTPLQRGRVATAKKKKAWVAMIRCFNPAVCFSASKTDTNTRTLERAGFWVISLRIKKLCSRYMG